jgi:signal peptide peptidase SppA
MQLPIHNPKCYNNHLGPWAIEPRWFTNAVKAIKTGVMKAVEDQQKLKASVMSGDLKAQMERDPNIKGYTYDGQPITWYDRAGSVAVIRMDGPMMKHKSKFGGVSTIETRQAIRIALIDEKVSSILMVVDSPGGSVAGTPELANEVKSADAKKPTYCFIEDCGASAAYWVASQARKIFTTLTSQIGSIGVISIVEDTSKQAEMQGVKVHVISTGEMKGAFTPGTEVTEEQLTYLQSIVDAINVQFKGTVAEGRQMAMKDLNAIADGRMYMASDAKKLGLVDAIQSLDDTLIQIQDKHPLKVKKTMVSNSEKAEILLRVEEESNNFLAKE